MCQMIHLVTIKSWTHVEDGQGGRPLLGDPVDGDAVAALPRYWLTAPPGDGLLQVRRLIAGNHPRSAHRPRGSPVRAGTSDFRAAGILYMPQL